MTSLFKQTDMVMELPLGVLRSTSGSSPPILLSLLDPRITCEKTSLFQNIFKLSIKLEKGLRDPVTDGNGLSGNAPSLDIHFYIELISGSSKF